MKRLFKYLFLLLLLSSMTASVVRASWSFDETTGLLVVSTNYNYDYISHYPWYSLQKEIKSVEISTGVTSIGDEAFRGCAGLRSITIGNSVTSIGMSAFDDCTGLTNITIPNSVTSIGDYAFDGCTGLTSITIGNSVTSIGMSAFNGCTGLTSITIPESVTSIGNDAFYNCTGLTSITIPESVTSIGNDAFRGCTGLTNITIPNSVTSIGDYAFDGCTGLTSITIPESVTSIGNDAFYGCTGLKSVINYSNLNITKGSSSNGYVAFYADRVINVTDQIGDFLFNESSEGNTLAAYIGNKTAITLPNDYKGESYCIGEYAFYKCTGLTNITIPESVTSIGGSAFSGCTGLTSITIPESVTEIGRSAFSFCSSLRSITIPEGVTNIGSNAFYGCSSLKSITIPESVANISYRAFYKCSGLTDITIPEGVKSIGEEAFYGCSSLTSIVIPESMTGIGDGAFYGCENLKTVYNLSSLFLVKGVYQYQGAVAYYADVLIDGWYFDGWRLTVTKNYDLDLVTEYPWYSFRSSIQSVKLGANVTTIGHGEFYQFYSLHDLIIPNSVTSIGNTAFADCISLRFVEIPEGVTSIGVNAFNNCYDLRSVYNYSSLDIVKGADTHGKVAYYAEKVLNFIKPLQLQKGEMYALSVPISNEMVVTWSSSDANVAAVDQNGNVTAVGTGVATITATAGDYSATCEVTVTLTDGVYYMKNVGAGLFLTGGNAWGTQGTFSENGFDVTVTMLPSGKFVIGTKVHNLGNHYLGADGFIDAPQAEWTIEPQTDGTYTITNDGVNYIGYDGSTTVLNLHLTNSSEDNAHWQFMTYEEVMAEISTATKDNPKIVTMLLPGASFNKNDTRNGLWSDGPTVGGYLTDVATNMCGEKWNTPSFDVAQTLTNVPNGYYKVSMQGFYRMGSDASKNDATIAAENHAAGTETLNAIFYANNEEKPLMSIIEGAQAEMFAYGQAFNTSYGYVPQNIGAAAATFTDGKYEHSLWVVVTDGTLRVGVKKDAESVNDWTIFDNFRIVYYGNHASGISIDRVSMKLLKGESMALSAEVTPEDAMDAVTWSSSDASVATVDQNGNVTAVGVGTATITATAGDYSATCEVTVTKQVSLVTLTDGVYYMKNVGAGLFLTGGNAWGTQGTFSENGFDVTVTTLPTGKYVIDTKVDNWGNHYLGADGFIDAPQAEWTIEPQTDGTYAITNDGVNYIGYDGSTTVLNLHLTNSSEDNARWQFVTYEEVMAEISTATKDNPKTVTMLLPGAAFNQGDTRNGLWSDEPAVGGYQTEFASNKCGEKYSTPSFDVAQTLTNVPNGYYKVSMQGFYRMGGDENVYDASLAEAHHKDGTETLNAIFYANNEEKRLMSIIEGAQAEEFAYGGAFYTAYGNVPQDMDAAAAAFTDGKYEHSLWVEVTDGTLRVGVKKDAESVRDWTIFDNFRVVYYGTQQPDAIEEATAIVTFQTNDVYDLSGRLVRRQAESLDGLKPGVYIVNGKKYMVK